jgi:hypothetical protein
MNLQGSRALTGGSRPSTPHQRLFIRTSMQQLDLDALYMTALHRRFFDAAHIPQPDANARLDSVLCGLTREQASALISALRKEIPNAD